MKVGEGNPQAREEEGKGLLGLEAHLWLEFPEFGNWNSVGKPPLWGLEFHGKVTAFTEQSFYNDSRRYSRNSRYYDFNESIKGIFSLGIVSENYILIFYVGRKNVCIIFLFFRIIKYQI